MSLRNKVTLMVVFVFLLSAALDMGIQRLVIRPSFCQLEQEEALKNTGRVMQALNRERQILNTVTADWASWDELYRYAVDQNTEFYDSNLTADTLHNLKANFMAIYDNDHNLIWGLFIDLDTDEILPMDSSLNPHLLPRHPTLKMKKITDVVSGILKTAHSPLMLSARYILTSANEGPPHGIFMVGRILDRAVVQRISDQVNLHLTIEGVPDGTPGQDWAANYNGNMPYTAIRLSEGKQVLTGGTLIADLDGQPYLELLVQTPRDISARGERSGQLAVVSIAFSAVLVMSLLLFMLHRTVTRPLSILTAHAVRVGENDDLDTRLGMNRRDEVGLLAREFDEAMKRLKEARAKLVDLSFHSGKSEMAKGVLHNIGNAVTPLLTQLTTLDADLRKTPAAELKSAVAMLSDPSGSAERRDDLRQFVELAGITLADEIGKIQRRLAEAVHQVEYVGRILAEQERFSRNAWVIEQISVQDLVEKSAELIDPGLRDGVAIRVDESVPQAGAVLSSRAALQQVVNNLLTNALESIRQGGATDGRILIRAVKEQSGDESMCHYFIEDNGAGIDAADLRRIFGSGFSTKGRGTGMGLHWSANIVNNMRGRLFAESAGQGKGACLHMILPAAGRHTDDLTAMGGKVNGPRS